MYLSTSILTVLALTASTVNAHTRFTTLFVDGQSQGAGTCVRMVMNASIANFPIADISSTDMTCGIGGMDVVNRTCPVTAGSTVSFRYNVSPDGTTDESIVAQHPGPCGIYMKQISTDVPSAQFPTTDPTGDGWFKIMYQDFDGKEWCTNKLNESSEGVISAVIPKDVAPGYYLLRPELLALHNATKGNPQFYVGCAQVYITGGSATATPETVSIPGYVNLSMSAMTFNVYNTPMGQYPGYGPALYKATTDGTPAPPQSSTSTPQQSSTYAPQPSSPCTPPQARKRADSSPTQTESITTILSCPSNTVLELDNRCFQEIAPYSDTSSNQGMPNCWAASNHCWDISNNCWNHSSPAVNNHEPHGCWAWDYRCTAIQNACSAGVLSGPPDAGKVLTEGKAKISGYGIM